MKGWIVSGCRMVAGIEVVLMRECTIQAQSLSMQFFRWHPLITVSLWSMADDEDVFG